jgi:integrase
LPGLPGSQAFMATYENALASTTQGAGKPKGGPKSLSALFANYYACPGFKNLSPNSQRLYRQALKPIEAAHGHRGVVDLPDDKAHKIIAEIGETRPAMANLTRSVLRRAFAHAIKPLKWRYTNPFSEIESYKVGSHDTWTDADFAAYRARWPLGSRERIAFDLLYYTAQRIGDVSKMRRADIKPQGIYVKQEKTETELHIPMHPGLKRSLNAYGIHGQHLIARLDGKKLLRSRKQAYPRPACRTASARACCANSPRAERARRRSRRCPATRR